MGMQIQPRRPLFLSSYFDIFLESLARPRIQLHFRFPARVRLQEAAECDKTSPEKRAVSTSVHVSFAAFQKRPIKTLKVTFKANLILIKYFFYYYENMG